MTTPENEFKPVLTGDGSHTLLHPVLGEYYHSLQGSLQESIHIFLNLGLRPKLEQAETAPVRIFEMGFGSGLNALLSWQLADQLQKPVSYTGIEAYPVRLEDVALLNYENLTGKSGLEQLHEASWDENIALSPWFSFRKIESFLQAYQGTGPFDVVYFDAFAPDSQPELWSAEVFARIGSMLTPHAVLVTYSSKGSVRRALREAGFTVEKHPGPGRKREVVRAVWPGHADKS